MCGVNAQRRLIRVCRSTVRMRLDVVSEILVEVFVIHKITAGVLITDVPLAPLVIPINR